MNLLVNLPGDFSVMAAVFSDARMETVRRNNELARLEREVVEAAVALRKNELEQRRVWEENVSDIAGDLARLQDEGREKLAVLREACDRLISERDK